VSLILLGPDKALVKVDNPNGAFGTDSVSILAANAATFVIIVQTTDRNRSGSYHLKVEGPRDKISGDEDRVRAERLFAEARQARLAGTAERYSEALDKYNQAGALWAQLDDRQHQAYAFCDIGRIYRAMGDLDKSLDYLDRARKNSEGIGDISGQAFDLNEIGATDRELGDPLQALDPYQQALKLREELMTRTTFQ
jgi:tetratricopeptide (TPR) repeat protein